MAPALIAMLVAEGIKMGKGIYDKAQAKKYAATARPPYEIPQSITDALNIAKAQATQTQLPGQGLMEEKLGAATASGMTAAEQATSSPATNLGMIAKLTEGEQGKIRDLGIAGATAYDTHQAQLKTALAAMGAEQQSKWEWDKGKPYLAAQATAANLNYAGDAQITGAMDGAINSMLAAKYAGFMDNDKKPIDDTAAMKEINDQILKDQVAKENTDISYINSKYPGMVKPGLYNPYSKSYKGFDMSNYKSSGIKTPNSDDFLFKYLYGKGNNSIMSLLSQ